MVRDDIEKYLQDIHEPYILECPIGDTYIFDLCLPKIHLLVEFDGKYHKLNKQKNSDNTKTNLAEDIGWKVIRISVKDNTIIKPSVLYSICKYEIT